MQCPYKNLTQSIMSRVVLTVSTISLSHLIHNLQLMCHLVSVIAHRLQHRSLQMIHSLKTNTSCPNNILHLFSEQRTKIPPHDFLKILHTVRHSNLANKALTLRRRRVPPHYSSKASSLTGFVPTWSSILKIALCYH